MRYLEPISNFEMTHFDPLREKRAELRLASRLRRRRGQLVRLAGHLAVRTAVEATVSLGLSVALFAALLSVLSR